MTRLRRECEVPPRETPQQALAALERRLERDARRARAVTHAAAAAWLAVAAGFVWAAWAVSL